jgi:xylan 1,4-beta-xylosidase
MSPLEADRSLITPYEIAYRKFPDTLYRYYLSVIKTPFDDMYANPIRRGFFPDPSIIRVNDDYYMVNSSFIFFPCIPVSHSTDLVHWQIIGHAVMNPAWSELGALQSGRGDTGHRISAMTAEDFTSQQPTGTMTAERFCAGR